MDGKVGGVSLTGFKIAAFELLCGCSILLKLPIGTGHG